MIDTLQFTAKASDSGTRIDLVLLALLPQYSRARLQDWIKSGRVRVNGATVKPSFVLKGGERIEVEPADLPPLKAEPEDLPISILYEDPGVIVVDKPAGQVVHAGAGNRTGTLVNALVYHFGRLSSVGGDLRPGIVHRLDRYTSGALLVARTDEAHRDLARQFAERSVEKTYVALVQGRVAKDSGTLTAPIARDPVHRTRMTSRLAKGRTAFTEYRVIQRFTQFTLLEIRIGTGRTHQIRVHLASIKHPVAGDTLYGAARAEYGRFFLHARRLAFTSPSTGERITVEAPLPAELKQWLDGL